MSSMHLSAEGMSSRDNLPLPPPPSVYKNVQSQEEEDEQEQEEIVYYTYEVEMQDWDEEVEEEEEEDLVDSGRDPWTGRRCLRRRPWCPQRLSDQRNSSANDNDSNDNYVDAYTGSSGSSNSTRDDDGEEDEDDEETNESDDDDEDSSDEYISLTCTDDSSYISISDLSTIMEENTQDLSDERTTSTIHTNLTLVEYDHDEEEDDDEKVERPSIFMSQPPPVICTGQSLVKDDREWSGDAPSPPPRRCPVPIQRSRSFDFLDWLDDNDDQDQVNQEVVDESTRSSSGKRTCSTASVSSESGTQYSYSSTGEVEMEKGNNSNDDDDEALALPKIGSVFSTSGAAISKLSRRRDSPHFSSFHSDVSRHSMVSYCTREIAELPTSGSDDPTYHSCTTDDSSVVTVSTSCRKNSTVDLNVDTTPVDFQQSRLQLLSNSVVPRSPTNDRLGCLRRRIKVERLGGDRRRRAFFKNKKALELKLNEQDKAPLRQRNVTEKKTDSAVSSSRQDLVERFGGLQRRNSFRDSKKTLMASLERQAVDAAGHVRRSLSPTKRSRRRRSLSPSATRRSTATLKSTRMSMEMLARMSMSDGNLLSVPVEAPKPGVPTERRMYLKRRLKVEKYSGERRRHAFDRSKRMVSTKLDCILKLHRRQALQASMEEKERMGGLQRAKSYKESRKFFQGSSTAIRQRATGTLRRKCDNDRTETRSKDVRVRFQDIEKSQSADEAKTISGKLSLSTLADSKQLRGDSARRRLSEAFAIFVASHEMDQDDESSSSGHSLDLNMTIGSLISTLHISPVPRKRAMGRLLQRALQDEAGMRTEEAA